ncbi:MAG: endo alpha-1,4 polygalactosaminidase [Bacteroidota bacterium]
MKNLFLLLSLSMLLWTTACKNEILPEPGVENPKQEMRDFVQSLSAYAKAEKEGFTVIPQNGLELLTQDGTENSEIDELYLAAIDGVGQENLYFGYEREDEATPVEETLYLEAFLKKAQEAGKTIMVTDYASSTRNMETAYQSAKDQDFVSFVAPSRELDQIPGYPEEIPGNNREDIFSLEQAQNFLYLTNPANYDSRNDFIRALRNSSYDVLIIDLFYDGVAWTEEDLRAIKEKNGGGKRKVIAYMSVGEAENYRNYWNADWDTNPPSWLKEENTQLRGNFKVAYWEEAWQKLIYGSPEAYLDQVIQAGFDGAYLDIVDAFEYFE